MFKFTCKIQKESVFLSRKTLFACLTLLALFLIADTVVRQMSMEAVTAMRTSDTPPGTLRISPEAHERMVILAPTAFDTRWWVLHAESFLRGDSWRVRSTTLDNAPEGREVHWSSSLIWLLAAMARGLAWATGRPAEDCVAPATFWAGPLLLVACLGFLGILAGRRYGAGLAGIFLLIFGTAPLIFQGFRAGETDHHGLVCAFATASVLCLVAGGGGWVRRDGKKQDVRQLQKERGRPARMVGRGQDVRAPVCHWPDHASARRWFILSGAMGGAALWISAASFIPILVGCAVGAMAVAFLLRDSAEDAISAPALWRTWAIAGCCSSLFFYLLEYFPHHMGWRLEVIHPLYALAWLGAGDLLARMLNKLEAASSRLPVKKKRPEAASTLALIASLIAIAAPLLLILLRPQDCYWVADRFVWLLHKEYIQEFQSFPRYLGENQGIIPILQMTGWPLFVLLSGGWLAWRGVLSRPWQALLALAIAPALVMQALAFWQIRWGIMATGLWTVCVLILLAGFFEGKTKGQGRGQGRPVPESQNKTDGTSIPPSILPWRVVPAVPWFPVFAAVWILASSLAFPLVSLMALSAVETLKVQLPKAAIPTLLLRDVSHRLVQSSPEHLPVVLSGPTSSTDLTYYGGIQTLGTLYWENRDGLHEAARIFDAQTETAAKTLLLQAGVSHVVISSWDDFGRGYSGLLRNAEGRSAEESIGFLERILRGTEEPPDWLRPLSYPIPQEFAIKDQWVKIFQVIPDQKRAEALLHRAMYWQDSGDLTKARALLEEAARQRQEEKKE